jgi:hypothetical protein
MTARAKGAAPAAPRPRSASGPNISEARRRELGYGTIKLRLPLDVLAILEEESERSDLSRAELVDSAIRLFCKSDGGKPAVHRSIVDRARAGEVVAIDESASSISFAELLQRATAEAVTGERRAIDEAVGTWAAQADMTPEQWARFWGVSVRRVFEGTTMRSVISATTDAGTLVYVR